MKLRNFLSASAVALALVGSSLTVPAAAVAAPANADPYTYVLDAENGKASAAANNYLVADGVTYFVATTLKYGRAIFSVTSNAAEAPKMVAHFETGSSIGDPTGLAVNGNYLFFFDKRDSWAEYSPYVANLTTGEVTQLSVNGNSIRGNYSGKSSSFASVGTHVYFQGKYMWYGQSALFNFNTEDGTVALETNLSFGLSQGGGTYPADRSNWETPNLVAVGTDLYMRDNGWNYIQRYSTVDKDISLVYPDLYNAVGAMIYGNFTYRGETGVLLGVATNMYNYNWTTYFIGSNQRPIRLGDWNDPFNYNWYVNFDNRLLTVPSVDPIITGQEAAMFEISQVDGSRTALDLLPGTDPEYITNATVVGNYLVFESAGSLWKWSGSGYATAIAGIASPTGSGSIYTAPGGATNPAISHVGNDIITSLWVDSATGFAPYRISLDGTKTPLGVYNQGSFGSSPNLTCSTSDATSDYILTNQYVAGSLDPQPALTVTAESNGKLKYQVINLGGVDQICGLAKIGSFVYFVGRGVGIGYGFYKVSTSGVVTRISDLDVNPPQDGFTDGTYYYYVGTQYDPYGSSLFQIDPSTGVRTQITGSNLPEGIVDIATKSNNTSTQPLVVGNKIYFAGTDGDNASWVKPFVATIDNSGAATVTALPTTETGGDYGFLTSSVRFYNFDGQVAMITGSSGDKFYKVDASTGEITFWFNAVGNSNSYQNSYSPVMYDGNLYFLQSAWGDLTLMKWDGATVSRIDSPIYPVGLAIVNGRLAIGDYNGRIALGDGADFTTYDNLFGTSNLNVGDALKNGLASPRGYFFSLSEYPAFEVSGDTYNWGNEVVYLGSLAPLATARNGSAVEEAPARKYLDPLPAFGLAAPNAPTGVTAAVGASVVNVRWTAAANGAAAEGYVVNSSPAGGQCEVTGVTAICSGLTAGTRYTFSVRAINSAGKSAPSATSNQVTAPLVGSVPVLVGDIRVGKNVTVNTGSWTSGVTLAYQWKRNGANIAGATANNYTPIAADYGKSLTVVVTGRKAGFANVSISSASSVIKSTLVQLTGKAIQGQVLEADSGSWPNGTTISYQWLRDGQAITGATKATYKVAARDAGTKLSFAVTGVNGSNTQTLTSAETARVPFKKFNGVGRAAMSSAAYAYNSVCAWTTGTWDAKARFSYQWYRNNVAISGATDSCFSDIGNDIGSYYGVVITAYATGYESISRDAGRVKVQAMSFGQLDKPQLIGNSTIGSNLTFDLGNTGWWWSWTNPTYQWLRNGVAIDGATGDNYTITSADKGKRVVVRVTVAWPGYKTQVLTSTTTTLITK